MSYYPRSKYLPYPLKGKSAKRTAVATCNKTGDIVPYEDLVKQYEWGGTGKYWTGLWVYKKNLDKPNAQLRAFTPKGDPVPLEHPFPVIWKDYPGGGN